MDINEIMEDLIEFRLGLDVMNLEKYYPKIKRVIEKKTLKTFSKYIPFEFEDIFYIGTEKNPNSGCLYNPKEMVDGMYQYNMYHPDLDKNKIDILSVISVKSNEGFLSGMGDSRAPTFDIGGMLEYSMMQSVKSKSGIKFKRWDYKPENILKLRGFGNHEVVIKLKIPYPNFASIPDGFSETFMELAEYDTMAYLYNQLKFIDNLDTPLGAIEMKIDAWESAKQDRKDWLEELEPEKLRQNLMSIGRFELRV